FMSRVTSLFLGWYHPNWVDFIMQRILYFIVWIFWRIVQFTVAMQQGLRKGDACYPTHPAERDVSCVAAVEPIGYFDAIRSGKIKPIRSTIKRCEANAVILENGTRVECDVLVLATGFKPNLSFMSDYVKDEKELPLYNHIIHPDIPDLAFLGFSGTFCFSGGVFLGALWFDAVIKGKIKLPSREEMYEKINRVFEFNRKYLHQSFTNNYCVGARLFRYFDDLMDGLGFQKRRKPFLLDFFVYYSARDYAQLLEKERIQ